MRRRRRIGGGTRKKRERAAVFDEEEEEGIGCARHWLLYTREIYSRCQPLAGSKGFFLAGHETAAHLYSRVGFPPESKGGAAVSFPACFEQIFLIEMQ